MTQEQDANDISAMLRDSARDYAVGEKDLAAFRRGMNTLPGYDVGKHARMHELGWQSALVSEEQGGAGMGLREAAAVAEELGKALLGEPYIATAVLPIRLLQSEGAGLPAAALVLRSAAGEATLALAWQEQAGSIDPEAIATSATRTSAGYELSGVKSWVAGAAAATDFLVSARIGDGVAVFQVPRDAAGLSLTHGWQADGTPAWTLLLDKVQVPADAELLSEAAGAHSLGAALDAAAVVASAELLGVSRAAFEMTLAYMRTRVQYDKLIGSFQALQHKAVDLLVQQELAAAVLEEAVHGLDEDAKPEAERGLLASRCKARCSDAALRITRECIQLHGAIGYTHEYDIGLYLKRALVLAAWLGNSSQHRRRHVAFSGTDALAA